MIKVYLAIPYTGIEEESFKIVNEVASILMNEGYIVYSPISHCHTIALEYKMPTDYEFWKNNCEAFVTWCDCIVVVNIDSSSTRGSDLIEKSKGVQAEVKLAISQSKEIYEYDYLTKTKYITI